MDVFMVYASGWYRVTAAELVGSHGQYAAFIAFGRLVRWDEVAALSDGCP